MSKEGNKKNENYSLLRVRGQFGNKTKDENAMEILDDDGEKGIYDVIIKLNFYMANSTEINWKEGKGCYGDFVRILIFLDF